MSSAQGCRQPTTARLRSGGHSSSPVRTSRRGNETSESLGLVPGRDQRSPQVPGAIRRRLPPASGVSPHYACRHLKVALELARRGRHDSRFRHRPRRPATLRPAAACRRDNRWPNSDNAFVPAADAHGLPSARGSAPRHLERSSFENVDHRVRTVTEVTPTPLHKPRQRASGAQRLRRPTLRVLQADGPTALRVLEAGHYLDRFENTACKLSQRRIEEVVAD